MACESLLSSGSSIVEASAAFCCLDYCVDGSMKLEALPMRAPLVRRYAALVFPIFLVGLMLVRIGVYVLSFLGVSFDIKAVFMGEPVLC